MILLIIWIKCTRVSRSKNYGIVIEDYAIYSFHIILIYSRFSKNEKIKSGKSELKGNEMH